MCFWRYAILLKVFGHSLQLKPFITPKSRFDTEQMTLALESSAGFVPSPYAYWQFSVHAYASYELLDSCWPNAHQTHIWNNFLSWCAVVPFWHGLLLHEHVLCHDLVLSPRILFSVYTGYGSAISRLICSRKPQTVCCSSVIIVFQKSDCSPFVWFNDKTTFGCCSSLVSAYLNSSSILSLLFSSSSSWFLHFSISISS